MFISRPSVGSVGYAVRRTSPSPTKCRRLMEALPMSRDDGAHPSPPAVSKDHTCGANQLDNLWFIERFNELTTSLCVVFHDTTADRFLLSCRRTPKPSLLYVFMPAGADPEGFLRGATWRAREREPIAGVWGPGAEPGSRGQGGEASRS